MSGEAACARLAEQPDPYMQFRGQPSRSSSIRTVGSSISPLAKEERSRASKFLAWFSAHAGKESANQWVITADLMQNRWSGGGEAEKLTFFFSRAQRERKRRALAGH